MPGMPGKARWLTVALACTALGIAAGAAGAAASERQGSKLTLPIPSMPGFPPYHIRVVLDPADPAAERAAGYRATLHSIGRVEVYRGDSRSPLQVIDYRTYVPASYTDVALAVELQDVNFDGFPDLMLPRDFGAKWRSFSYFVFDPAAGRFLANTLTADLARLQGNGLIFDPKKRRITVPYLTYPCANGIRDVYEQRDGHLLLVEDVRFDHGKAITEERAGDRMVVRRSESCRPVR
jgi:hypothetical protein